MGEQKLLLNDEENCYSEGSDENEPSNVKQDDQNPSNLELRLK